MVYNVYQMPTAETIHYYYITRGSKKKRYQQQQQIECIPFTYMQSLERRKKKRRAGEGTKEGRKKKYTIFDVILQIDV